jgi:pyrimidine-specific ribonucleoside hydrolase
MARISAARAQLLVAVILLAAACSASDNAPSTAASDTGSELVGEAPGETRTPTIVDYSPTVSDVGALLYLLAHPDVDVLAITLPVTGEAGCELGIEVTLGVLAMYGREDVPVACDPERPAHAEAWPDEFLTGHESLASGLPGISHMSGDARPAHQLIADVVAASDRPVTLFAVAPLTNVARALDLHPEVRERLGRIVVMGGAVDVPGNVAGTNAEWNIWIDVLAAARVLASEAPVTLVPLDATDHVPVPGLWLEDVEGAAQSEAVMYLASLVRSFPAVTSGFFYLWDELAASIAAGEDLVATEKLNLTVVEEAGPAFGSTVRDPGGDEMVVATGVPNPTGFYAHFLATLAGAAVEQQAPLTFDEASAPSSVTSSSSPAEVLAYWLLQGIRGDVEAAASVVAPGTSWVGFGATHDVYVDGSQPFGSFDAELECTSDAAVAFCDMTWSDLWIGAIPELERGKVQVEAQIVDGKIVAFQGFLFSADVSVAFEHHMAWLETEHPKRAQTDCAPDPAARVCSELIVGTVEEWVANR